MFPKLDRPTIISICALAGVDEHTVRRLLRGGTVRDTSRERITDAAVKLGISLPAPPSEAK